MKGRKLSVSEKKNQRIEVFILEKDGKGMKYVGEQMCYNDSDGDTDGDYSILSLSSCGLIYRVDQKGKREYEGEEEEKEIKLVQVLILVSCS